VFITGFFVFCAQVLVYWNREEAVAGFRNFEAVNKNSYPRIENDGLTRVGLHLQADTCVD
jgi:hypothetical protein